MLLSRRTVLFIAITSLVALPLTAAQDAENQTGDDMPAGEGYFFEVTAMEGDCEGGLAFCFEPNELRVQPGAEVTIQLVNPEGNVAGHNFVFQEPLQNVMIPGPGESDLLQPGETGNATFTAPSEETSVDFYCVPHQTAGMVGALVVAEDAPAPGEGNGEGPIDGVNGEDNDGPEEAGPENGTPGFTTVAAAVAAVGVALFAGRRRHGR